MGRAATDVAKKHTRTVLLSDYPEAEDRFGSHQRVADAIASMIREEAGGYAIALEGTWGSGKSTIVNLLRNVEHHMVFVFDAWAHEGDPLRRVFLESLIDHCLPSLGRKRQKHWTHNRKTLSKRRRTVVTTSRPLITRKMALVAMVATAYPLALMMVHGGIKDGLPWHWSQWVALVVIVIPIAFAFLAWLKPRREDTTEDRDAGDLLQLWIHKARTKVTSDSAESPEPTSIEFQTMFTDLLAEYLTQPNRRLLIVLDNLDRIPNDQALSLWATLRVFMDCLESSRHSWAAHAWLLVPYDRSAVERLWAHGLPDKEERTEEAPTAPGTPAAFLDKTFQIRFEVPPLILVDWKQYLRELLATAFRDHDNYDEQHGVYRISAIVAEEKGRAPTPRHLKLYVNDIGAIRRQYGARFPLHHMAYYAILRRKGIDVRYALLKGRIPEAAYASVLGRDIADHLAAMCFNTDDIDKARDLLLHGPIVRALSSGNADELSSLAQRPGFWPVAESLLPELPTRWGGEPLPTCNGARAIAESGIAHVAEPAEARKTVSLFAKGLADAAKWTQLDEGVATGAAALITLAEDSGVTVAVVRGLTAVEPPTTDETPDEIEEWARGLITLLTTPTVQRHQEAFADGIEVSGSPEAVVQICAQLADEPETMAFWSTLRTTAPGAAVLAACQPEDSPTPWSATKARAFEVLRQSQIQVPWDAFVDACGSALRVARAVAGEQVSTLLDALEEVPANAQKKARMLRQELVEGGYLTHHLHSCRTEEAADAAAHLLHEIGIHAQLASAPAGVGQGARGKQLINGVLTDPSSHDKVIEALCARVPVEKGSGFLASLIEQQPATAKLAAACLARLKEEGRLIDIATPQFLRAARRGFRSAFESSDLSYEDVLRDYVEDARLLNDLASAELDYSELGLHRELLAAGASANTSYSDWLCEQLTRVDRSLWQEALSNDGELLHLLADFRAEMPQCKMGGEFANGIGAFAGAVLTGEWSGEEEPARWTSVLEALPDHARQVLGKDVLDLVRSPGPDELRSFFMLFREILPHASEYSEAQNAVRLVFLPIVQSDVGEAREWMAETLEHSDEILAKAPVEDLATLKERISEQLTESQDPALVRIGEVLGITQPPGEAEEDQGVDGGGSDNAQG